MVRILISCGLTGLGKKRFSDLDIVQVLGGPSREWAIIATFFGWQIMEDATA